jgi:hypothetical protein
VNDEHPTTEAPRAIRFVTEAVIGLALAAAVALAALASTGEIPFVYQGY